jgi:hypothetical protein
MVIKAGKILAVDDHILPDEGQHWVSATYIAEHVSGTPEIKEIGKCSAIGWFKLDNLPQPLSLITQYNIRDYLQQKEVKSPPNALGGDLEGGELLNKIVFYYLHTSYTLKDAICYSASQNHLCDCTERI